MTRIVVVGIGNDFRGDDGAGLQAARLLRPLVPADVEVLEHDGDPTTLIDCWQGAEVAYVVDAIRSDDPVGTVHRLEIVCDDDTVVQASSRGRSSHALGVGDAVGLARALGRLPRRLVLIGITAASFEAGHRVGQPVRRAVTRVVGELVGELT
jgi:hydrogenase maturation protease